MPAWFSSASLTSFCNIRFSSVSAGNLRSFAGRQSVRLLLCLPLLPAFWLYGPTLQAQTFTPSNSPFSESRFLPVDEAFSYYTSIDSSTQLTVNWQIAEGYYLYQEKFAYAYISPATVDAKRSESAKVASIEPTSVAIPFVLPEGVSHFDEFFGAVEVYYLGTTATLTLPNDIPREFTLVIEFQGCSEDGLCYPPQKREIEILL